MPSNVEMAAGSGGSKITTKKRTHDGDPTQSQAVTLAGVTGTEDAYTYADINGSTANGLEVDVTRVQGTVTVDGSGVTQPVSGTVAVSGTVTVDLGANNDVVVSGSLTTVSTVTNLSQLGGQAVAMGTGLRSAGTQRVTIATDDLVPVTGTVTANAGTGTFAISAASLPLPTGAATAAKQLADNHQVTVSNASLAVTNAGLTDLDAAITAGKMSVDIAAQSGSSVTIDGSLTTVSTVTTCNLAAETTKVIGTVNLASGSNIIGNVGISGLATSGGTTLHTNAGVSTLKEIKSSAGQLYWLHAVNLKASVLYIQVFNKASASVTLGTTVADMVFPIPTQGNTNGAGFTMEVTNGIAMGNGISYAITTTPTGATAASANEAFLNAGYA